MMNIIPFTSDYTSGVVELWNKEATKYHYKPFTEETFVQAFIEHQHYDPQCMWVGCEDGKVIAFAAGCSGDDLPLGDVAGYITCVIVDTATAQKSDYNALIWLLEKRFLELGKKQAEVLFFNPTKLIWTMPSEPRHEHNNAPGISKEQPLYEALIERGYADRATQCGMYLPLGQFTIPADVMNKEDKANRLGYKISEYDANVHTELDALLAALQNPQWQKDITQFAQQGVPIVMAIYGTQCVGFAGPIVREHNGRAFFSGIGVHPAHEGHGLGSVLFFRMVEAFQHAGCDYVTLFTGSNNPAIRIYQKAGFTIEKEFSILRKELER